MNKGFFYYGSRLYVEILQSPMEYHLLPQDDRVNIGWGKQWGDQHPKQSSGKWSWPTHCLSLLHHDAPVILTAGRVLVGKFPIHIKFTSHEMEKTGYTDKMEIAFACMIFNSQFTENPEKLKSDYIPWKNTMTNPLMII